MKIVDKVDKRSAEGAIAIRALEAPSSGNRIYYDDEVKGFGVRVTAGGARSFILNYRVGGRERRYTIGAHPDWSVTAARKEAGDLKKRIDKGEDPMGERHAERAAPTVAELIDRFKADYLPRKRESTQRDYGAILDKLVRPELGPLKVADIRHADVDALHRKVSARAPYRANRMAAVLSKMFAFAMKLEWAERNPVKGLERNHEDRRERYMSGDELTHLSSALQEHSDQRSANAVRLLLLTGARRMEVLAARWDQFDLAAGVWVKPSAHTKQKREHRVPLSAPALLLLTEMRQAAEAAADKRKAPVHPHVFPGDGGGAHLTDVKRTWKALAARATVRLWAAQPDTPAGKLVAKLTGPNGALPSFSAVVAAAKGRIELPPGLTDVRIHDLRHSYASILASAGLSLPIIGALLGHTQPATTARYAHLFDDPLRAATERVGAVLEAAKAPKTAQVVAFKGGKR